MYVTPRDRVVVMKLQHRNLWVAKQGGLGPTGCTARGCQHEESQMHLVLCDKMGYWPEVWTHMNQLQLLTGSPPASTAEKLKLWVAFQLPRNQANPTKKAVMISEEAAAYITWAWRALYAEIIAARDENRNFRAARALRATARWAYLRVLAHGIKWRTWYLRQRYWQANKTKIVPEEKRENTLITCDEQASFTISPALVQLYKGQTNT